MNTDNVDDYCRALAENLAHQLGHSDIGAIELCHNVIKDGFVSGRMAAEAEARKKQPPANKRGK